MLKFHHLRSKSLDNLSTRPTGAENLNSRENLLAESPKSPIFDIMVKSDLQVEKYKYNKKYEIASKQNYKNLYRSKTSVSPTSTGKYRRKSDLVNKINLTPSFLRFRFDEAR